MSHRQGLHLFLTLFFWWVATWIYNTSPSFGLGSLWGISSTDWLLLAVASSLVHQVFVWISWRGELHHKLMSRLFGQHCFLVHRVIFFILVLLRPIVITALAVSNMKVINISHPTYDLLIVLLTVPFLWTMYSVKRFFGFMRATGGDHFDKRYCQMGLVKEGVFKYIPNAMYCLGLLGLWLPGIIFESSAALLAAGYHHAAIWAHYYCVEKPDMATIYGKKN